MKTTVLAAAIAACSFATCARAEVISYQCNFKIGRFVLSADTNTQTSTDKTPSGTVLQGSARITKTTIVFFGYKIKPGWEGRIDRATGAYTDTDGDTSACRPL